MLFSITLYTWFQLLIQCTELIQSYQIEQTIQYLLMLLVNDVLYQNFSFAVTCSITSVRTGSFTCVFQMM